MILLLCLGMQAQKKRARNSNGNDTLVAMRDFVHVCNAYKQLPLYLNMEIIGTTNFITGEDDTTRSNAVFYMKPGITYIRFGETEQLVNDSMALLVSSKLQRMILYSNAQAVLQRMNAITGILQQDTSLQNMAKIYSARSSGAEEQVASITLTGRNILKGTSLPKESIELQYDQTKKEPLKVTALKRALVPLSEDDYKALHAKGEMEDKLLTIEGIGHCLVKEQMVSFVFNKIAHDAAMAVPATIDDRIIKNGQGEFMPVKAYEGYAVTQN
ncbi:hypothetical protein FAM09_29610 [Niastella caeni]|uniref:Uncharacterized protein n=1 Tax=Niastella caeni TaxID=2569763 RepID=A0A4S8H9N5_9BACT|nr:hypothetical protein [Niastella caeni]THU30759.1 hypothetical protein FAM09_29610 [Niastella caeni]